MDSLPGVPMRPMLWELLVTDGHVRAARLRYLAPFGILAGVLLFALGWFVLSTGPSSQQFYSNSDFIMRQRADEARQPVLNTFAQVPALSVSSDEVPHLVPESALPDVYKAVRDGMAAGKPPVDLSIVKAKSAGEFWSWAWPHDRLISLDQGDLRAFGAVVFSKGQPGQSYPGPVRWLAIFRRFPSGWDDVAIQANGFTAPAGEKTAAPADLVLSLRKLMDLRETPP